MHIEIKIWRWQDEARQPPGQGGGFIGIEGWDRDRNPHTQSTKKDGNQFSHAIANDKIMRRNLHRIRKKLKHLHIRRGIAGDEPR